MSEWWIQVKVRLSSKLDAAREVALARKRSPASGRCGLAFVTADGA
jgi:hypothetical protein